MTNETPDGTEITMHALALDWVLLREQKLFLLKLFTKDTFDEMSEFWNNNAGQDVIDGLLGLIDTLQDQAAEQLGEVEVFGPPTET